MEKTTFQTLSEIDITGKTKEKNKMKYLPWSSAWEIVKTYFPDATYEIIRTAEGMIYFTDGRTCWVETSVTINNETQHEVLAVMDFKNQAIPYENVKLTDVNKSIKRCLTKNTALFGLGLSLYTGEELSDNAKKKKEEDAAVLTEKREKIIALAQEKIASGIDKNVIYEAIEKISGNRNPNNIKSTEVADKVIATITKLNK